MRLEIVAAALVGVAAVWWVLQPLIAPGTPRMTVIEPLDPEETPKGVALAALKEIEFDRETGKLSDEDYAFLKGKYTGAALEALRAESAEAEEARAAEAGPGSGGGDVEIMIAARVRALRSAAISAPPGGPACPACGPRPESDAEFCSSCGDRLHLAAASGPCAGCGAELGADSRFCAQCGTAAAA
ncbi:MAG: zinc ribbon domain-containing protein [Gemmatimonadetes bacterium]|nr:zinc ribbon domain-containing protein [Gemmatimonadota bacterium]